MCPPLVFSLALTAASAAASQQAAAKVDRARTQASIAESTRQDELQRRAIGNVDTATAGFTPDIQSQGIELAAQERTRRLEGNAAGAGDQSANDLPLTGSAPNIVREVAARELSKGLDAGKSFAGRLARFGAFGENQFQNRINLGRLSETLGQIGSESSKSAAILPLEFQDANKEGDSLRNVSDILGGLGSAANLASATNAFGSPSRPQPGRGPDIRL